MATKQSAPVLQVDHPVIYHLAQLIRYSKDSAAKQTREASKAQGDLTDLILDVLPEDGLGSIEAMAAGRESLYRITRSISTRRSLSIEKLLELGVDPSIIEQAHTTTESYSLRITEQ